MGIFLFLDRTLDWEILSLTLAARVWLNIILDSRVEKVKLLQDKKLDVLAVTLSLG